MTYKEKYYEIINTGYKTKPETGYYEGHHIVPKSICPLLKKSQNNIVYLTAKNHFLAHYYIWKWFKEELKEKKWARKMCFALTMMKRQLMKSNDIERLSDLYEEVRKELGEIQKGKKLSEEAKKKISEANKGKIGWNKGKSGIYTEETRRKISDATKMAMSDPTLRKHLSDIKKGKPSPNKGKKMSEEQKQKLSDANKGKKISEEAKKKISIKNKGKNNPMFGKSSWPNDPQKYEMRRLKMIQTQKNLKWWNNGTKMTKSKECPGPEWQRGRIKKKNAGN